MFSPSSKTPRKILVAAIAVLFVGFANQTASAIMMMHCPFCSAVSQTFSEEMDVSDVVVIASLVAKPKEITNDLSEAELADAESGRAEFSIKEIIKGEKFLEKGMKFKTVYFGDATVGESFLVMGVEPPSVLWSTPLKVEEETIKYVKAIPALPKKGVERIKYFQDHLESEIDVLARDSYDEFAKAPYKDIIDLKKFMNHDKLIDWVKDPDIPASRKRLYYTMLGVCGTEKDCELYEELMKSPDRLKKAGLDALIASYLTLKGAEGLPFIEENFLASKKSDYSDTYQAISALRFHGTEADVIPKERMLSSLKMLLKRPRLADLVIPDLARWEDWSAMEELVDLFKNSTKESSWVRVPVINYLRACPLEKADKYIEELKEIDPNAVKRAMTFFPLLDDEDEDEEDEEFEVEESDKAEESKKESVSESSESSDLPILENPDKKISSDSPILENPDRLNGDVVSNAISGIPLPPEDCTGAEKSDSDSIKQVSVELPIVQPTPDQNQNQTPAKIVSTEEVVQQQADMVADNTSNLPVASGEAVVAEIPFGTTAMIYAIPPISSLLLLVFLWLVISGRVDRIWV